MKEHFCPAEQSTITYQGKCNWCGESEGSMTQDKIIEMAIENTINGLNFNQEGLVCFANLVAAKALAQRTWVGLTDEEIKPCWYEACQTDLELTSQLVVYFAKAIEAKLKQKNGYSEEKNNGV